jgi:hypothetical protein
MSIRRTIQNKQYQPPKQNQIYANPTFRPPQPHPNYRRTSATNSVASGSVYDPDESRPTARLTLKQAITLITLRLGKLEVSMNDVKYGIKSDGTVDDGSKAVDKDLLISIITRLDNVEKIQHNMRIEFENINNDNK